MSGGGARAAYQVGVLCALSRRFPELAPTILTGVSAGAINAAYIANHTGAFGARIESLAGLWTSLDYTKVFETRAAALVWRVLRVGLRLSVGMPSRRSGLQGMVDTAPLRGFLIDALDSRDGNLDGIRENLQCGPLKAVALITTRYSTGQTVTFFSGSGVEPWTRPQRVSLSTDLTVDHVMGSAALPLFFPAVRIGDDWYGDGGVRMVAPLAPAVHLGADKIIVVSTSHPQARADECDPVCMGPPTPALIVGHLYNAIFLDQLEHDAMQLERINRLVEDLPPEKRGGLRKVRLFVVRPSVDLGRLANEFEPELPKMFRYFTRRLGTREANTQDFLSTVMFQPDYVTRLLEVGRADGRAKAEELAAFLES